MATMQHKIFCVRELIKTESATAVQRAFRLRFNLQPPTRKIKCSSSFEEENLGPSLSNVMQIIHIPCIVQEI